MHHDIDGHDLDEEVSRAASILRRAQRVTVLTGAGVSAESGVATFRGAGGLWEGHPIEDVATPEGFERDPRLVWRFYNMRRNGLRDIKPNAGHRALAKLEQRLGGGRFTLATQNIDGLHQAAGSVEVLELHGRLTRVKCTKCTYLEDRPGEDLPALPHCPECNHLLRPDVVWFHEMLPQKIWREASMAADHCDCFLVVGTTALVYPAAGLIQQALRNRAKVLEFNLEKTAASSTATVTLLGPAGQLLPQVIEAL
ncbi:MAG: NAD-dependent deacylase [Gemmataceae bacterium]